MNDVGCDLMVQVPNKIGMNHFVEFLNGTEFYLGAPAKMLLFLVQKKGENLVLK